MKDCNSKSELIVKFTIPTSKKIIRRTTRRLVVKMGRTTNRKNELETTNQVRLLCENLR